VQWPAAHTSEPGQSPLTAHRARQRALTQSRPAAQSARARQAGASSASYAGGSSAAPSPWKQIWQPERASRRTLNVGVRRAFIAGPFPSGGV
jgi:hypothetical protein